MAAACLFAIAAKADKAQSLIDKTRNTTATYAAYQWMIQRGAAGEIEDGWASEFNRGVWHRVETAKRNALSNCRTGDTYVYELATGELQHSVDETHAVCGISEGSGITSAEVLPDVRSPQFGSLRALHVADAVRDRHYWVDRRGAVVAADWFWKDGSPICLIQQETAIFDFLPSNAIFTVASLKFTFTPEGYRRAPKSIVHRGPSGRKCI